jgi:sugar lactone lactonase YvrE
MLQFVYALTILPDGKTSGARKFCQLELPLDMQAMVQFTRDFRGPCSPPRHFFATSGAEGCAVDSSGNIYVATSIGVGIQVFDSSGKRIENIPVTGRVTGCAFGGADMRTLYVSTEDGIHAIGTRIPGLKLAIRN